MKPARRAFRTLFPSALVPALLAATYTRHRIVQSRAERQLWDTRIDGLPYEGARKLADMGPGAMGPLVAAAVPLLIEHLDSDAVAVQVEAVNALGVLWSGDVDEARAIASRVQGAPEIVRNRAAHVLGVPVRTGPDARPPGSPHTQDTMQCPNGG